MIFGSMHRLKKNSGKSQAGLVADKLGVVFHYLIPKKPKVLLKWVIFATEKTRPVKLPRR